MELGVPINLNGSVVALIDSNIAGGTVVVFEQASNSTFGADYALWVVTAYAQSGRRVMRWYLGSWGAGSTAQQFFRITISANGTLDSDGDGVKDSQYVLGNLWIGTYRLLPMSFGLTRKIMDPSLVSKPDSGAVYADVRRKYHQIGVDSDYMDAATAYSLQDELDVAGSTRHVLMDLWPNDPSAVAKANGCYYGTLGAGKNVASLKRAIAGYDNVDFDFAEARS